MNNNIPEYIYKLYEEGEQFYKSRNLKEWIQSWIKALDELKIHRLDNIRADLFRELGFLLFKEKIYSEAKIYSQQALILYRELEDFEGESLMLHILALIYDAQENFDKALDYFREALTIYRKLNDKEGESATLDMISGIYYCWRQYDKAIRIHKQLLTLYQEIEDKEGQANTLNNLGNIFEWINLEKSLDFQRQALNLYKEIRDKEGEARTLNYIGTNLYVWGLYENALEYHQQALTICVDNKIRIGEAQSLNFIGGVYTSLGECEQAFRHHQQAFTIYDESDDQSGKAMTLYYIGQNYSNWGRNNEALDSFEQSLIIYQTLQDKSGEKEVLNNIGLVYNAWSKFDKALKYFNLALTICQDLKDKRSESEVLNNIGNVFEHWGKYDKAKDHFLNALKISREINNKKIESQVLNNLGNIFFNWSDYEEAIEYYQQALCLCQEINYKKGESLTIYNIGSIYLVQGINDRALKCFKDCKVISHMIKDKFREAFALYGIGLILFNKHQYEEAKINYQQALDIFSELKDSKWESRLLNSIGEILIKEDLFDEALKYYRKSLAIKKEIKDKMGERDTLIRLGNLYFDRSDYFEAIKYLKPAVTILEHLISLAPGPDIRINARSKQLEILSTLIPCLIFSSEHEHENALAYIEYYKAREMTLKSSTENIKPNPKLRFFTDKMNANKEVYQRLVLRIKKLNQIYENGNVTLDQYNSQYNKIVSEQEILLKNRKQLYRDFWTKHQSEGTLIPTKPSELINNFRKKMPSNWIILDYCYLDNIRPEQLIIFCFTKTDEKSWIFNQSVTKRELNKLATETAKIIELRKEFKTKEADKRLVLLGGELFRVLVPLDLQIYLQETKFRYLTIIPTGKMHAFPLELIHDGDNYWGLKYDMSRAFNLQTLRAAIALKKKRRKKIGLVVGNPTVGIEKAQLQILDDNFNRKGDLGIDHARKEANIIKNILERSGFEIDPLMEYEANVNAFLTLLNNKPYSLIHFSGHAFFDSSNPEMSWILLREGNTPIKLYGNKIPLEVSLSGKPLVIFSACETGRVDIQVGDEIFGLVRGFIEAGASGILITGWNVFSDSPIDFFSTFYEHFRKGVPISKALKLARIDVHTKAQEVVLHEKVHFTVEADLLHWGPFRFYGLPF